MPKSLVDIGDCISLANHVPYSVPDKCLHMLVFYLLHLRTFGHLTFTSEGGGDSVAIEEAIESMLSNSQTQNTTHQAHRNLEDS
jgi:hypothetical protein